MGSQLPQKRHSPKFSAHVCCGQTAGWIKLQLGMEIGLGPGDIVLDGDVPISVYFTAIVEEEEGGEEAYNVQNVYYYGRPME